MKIEFIRWISRKLISLSGIRSARFNGSYFEDSLAFLVIINVELIGTDELLTGTNNERSVFVY